jgi:ANTAR domain
VGSADTLVAAYDTVELARQLIDSATSLLPITAAGILLGDTNGELHLLTASSDSARLVEKLQLHAGAGPCLDPPRSGHRVLAQDLSASTTQWPAFTAQAGRCGFRARSTSPMRLREERVGGLNLFLAEPGLLPVASLGRLRVTGVATIGIMHQRVLSQPEQTNQQLQTALSTRLVIEQAKGVLAERGGIDMDRAFTLLRGQARITHRRVAELARAIIEAADTVEMFSAKPSR